MPKSIYCSNSCPANDGSVRRKLSLVWILAGLLAQGISSHSVDMPCPEPVVIATNLLGPAKVIQTLRGNFLVAEVGPPDQLNSARVSIVDRNGRRRSLLEGLPSARAFVGDPSGVSGIYLSGRTLYVVNGQGDVTLAGPIPGTEKANPLPASPIFTSVLAVDFPESMESNTTGFVLTLADHHALKDRAKLVLTNAAGETASVRVVADFADYVPEPRPFFADNVRHSHPYGIVADETHLYVIDAGFNNVRKVEIESGSEQILVSFPPTRSPLTNGPPVIENVPTSIHWVGGQLWVTTLGGAPFLPGYSKVVQVDPRTGLVAPLVEGLTTAIDSTPLTSDSPKGGVLVLEFDLNFPQPGPGRLQSFSLPKDPSVVHSSCLVTPTSMLIDRSVNRLIVSESATGRLVWLPAPPSLMKGGHIYFSEFVGGTIQRANLDGTGKRVVVSGLSNPIGPAFDLAQGHMYWGEVSIATMRRSNLDGTRQTTVVPNPNGGLPTFDFARGRMYGVISTRGLVWSADLDGSNQQVLVTGQNDPHAVVLDASRATLYWPEFGTGRIWRARVDGSEPSVVVRSQAGPSLMALDVDGGRMYWSNQGSGEIRRANLDGTNPETVVRNQSTPSGVALDPGHGHIYWSTLGGGDIRRANLDGSGEKVLIRGLSGPAFIALDLNTAFPPSIVGTVQSGGGITLRWNALLGRAYQVQFSSDLIPSNWAALGSRMTATNTTATAFDPVVSDPHRFYRVQLVP